MERRFIRLSGLNHYSTNRRFVVQSVERERAHVSATGFIAAASACLLPMVNFNTDENVMQAGLAEW
jgi:hypothetical protein